MFTTDTTGKIVLRSHVISISFLIHKLKINYRLTSNFCYLIHQPPIIQTVGDDIATRQVVEINDTYYIIYDNRFS